MLAAAGRARQTGAAKLPGHEIRIMTPGGAVGRMGAGVEALAAARRADELLRASPARPSMQVRRRRASAPPRAENRAFSPRRIISTGIDTISLSPAIQRNFSSLIRQPLSPENVNPLKIPDAFCIKNTPALCGRAFACGPTARRLGRAAVRTGRVKPSMALTICRERDCMSDRYIPLSRTPAAASRAAAAPAPANKATAR